MPSNTRPNQYEVKRGSDVIFKGYPTYHGSYMKPCYIEFTNVSVPAPLDLKVGDEVNYTRLGETFKLYEIPEPKKQASSNQSGEAYVYDSIKFYDAAKVLEIALFRNLVENGQYHFSSDTEVSITTNVAGVAGMIQECLRSYTGDSTCYTGDSTWSVYLYNDAAMQSAYETAVAKDYSASGTCMNALDALSELWNGIGWVYRYINNVHTIIIGYPNVVATTAGYADNNRTMRFAMGSGLRNIKCTPAPIGDFCTRLYPFGSDRNMITGYYQNNTDVYQHASCYIKHLMLPLSEWGITDGKRDASKAFIRCTDLETEFGVIPKEIRFDGSGDYPEVYPSIEKVTAKNIRDAKTALSRTDYVPNATIYPDATRMDTIKAITMPTDDGTASSDGDKYTDKLDQTIATPAQVSVAIPAGGSEYIKCMLTDSTFQREGVIRMDLSDIKFAISGASGLEIDTQSEYKAVFVELRTSLGTKQYDLTQYAEQAILSSYEASVPLITLPDLGTQNNPATGAYAIYLYVLLKNTTQSAITATGVFQNMEGQFSPLVIHWARKIVIADTFNIKLKQIGFDMKARAVQCGSSPVISMKSGMCAGREFSVVTKSVQYDASDDSWTMTLQRVKDESVGMVYPNTNYPIAVGDEFAILEIEMPEEYIHMASSRLSELANATFSKLISTAPTYEPELDSKYIYIQQSAATPLENTFLRVGKWMWLSDANVVGATDINVLISSLTINEGESNIPTFKVSLVEFKRTGVVTQTQKQVVMLASEVSTMQTAQRAAMRDYSSGDVGGGGTATGGNSGLPVYMDNGEAFPIEGLEVDGNIISTAGGVSAKGLCDLSIHTGGGGGGGGTTDYRDLENKPKINGTTLSGNVSLATLGIAPASHNHSGTYEPVINSSHKISADNVDDRTSTNKFVTASEKSGFHTHSNKAILDGIAAVPYVKPADGIPDTDLQEAHYTESEVDALMSDKVDKVSGMGLSKNDYSDTEKQKVGNAYNVRHSHSNKELLDSYTQTEANITDAVSKKHSHSNKNLLDTYNQTNANLADAVTKRHSHSNKGLIDTYTQTENNLADAVSKKHSHDNKSLLDGYTHENAELSTAITMASSAIQGVKIDNSDLTKDADNKVNIPNAGASSTGLITATAQTIGGDKTFNGNVQSHGGVSADGMCDLTISGSGGGGTTDYADLSNKPKINGNELSGNKTSSILGLADSVHTHTAAQVTGLAEVATSGSYNDLSNKPTIPAAQIQSDWEQTNASAKDYIKNKPAIPVVNDGKLTIKQNGSKKGEFTANDTDNVTIELTDTIYDDTELTGRVTSVETTIGGYGNIVTHEASEFATAAQGVKADTAVQPAAISDMETKTHAGNTYAPISTTYTKNDVNGLLSNKADTSALTSHTSDTNNPHSVTKEQVGLSNVDNTSDLNKPISTATQTALDGKANKNGSSSEDFAVKNLTASGGVSADGMCDLTVQGAGGGGVSDFNDLSNRPKYNGNPMTGSTSIPLVNADYWNAKADTSAIPTKTSDLTNDGDGTNAFLTQHQSLSAYSTTSQMNAAISNHHDSSKADASALTSHTGNTDIHVTQSDKSNWNGKQSAITASNKLPSDLVDDTNHTNKFVSQDEKDAWSAKLDKVTGATAGHVATLTSDGTLQDGTYTIAKSVPSDAVFTDTTYGAGRGISLSSSGNFGHSNESITPVGEHGLKLLKVRVDAYGHITNYDAGIDDKIITIAGQDIAPRGSITAETIGNALTSSAPAAYATTAKDYDTSTGGIKDAIDGINDSLNDKLEGITANGEATTITSHIANIPAADATHSGVVSKSAQVFAGNKTFNGSINGQSGISAKGMCDLSVLESGGGVVFGEWQTLVSGVQYRKLGTMVVFRGACNVQDLTSYDINYFVPIGTLASGFRPNADITIEQTLILYMGLIEAEQRGSKTIGNAELKITTTGAIGFRLFQWMYDTRFDMWGRLDFNGMIIFTD